MLRRLRLALWALVAIMIALGAGLAAQSHRRAGSAIPSDPGVLPRFSLIERDGRIATEADLKGRVTIVTFIFTRCTESCPLQTARMAQLQREIDDERLRLVSVTVDPSYDTPAVLSAYAARVGARPDRWLFLTGAPDAIWRFADDALGLLPPARSAAGAALSIAHTSGFLLVDRGLRIRRSYSSDAASVDELRRDTLALLHELPARTARLRP
jgi:cytochrome oxidase Cu insertion factor (SCO1/SenC/PrrC family)